MALLTIFGERPGPNTDPKNPLFPHTTTGAAARLIRLLDWTPEFYLENTLRYNVVDNSVISCRNSNAKIRVNLRINEERRANPRARFLFLGRETAHAVLMHKSQKAWLPGEIREDTMYIPHPSGRNLYYNSAENTALIKNAWVSLFS